MVLPKKKRGPKRVRHPRSKEAERIGREITRLRDERGWTAETLAEKAEISQPMVSKIEGGLVDPSNARSHGTIRKIARLFGTTLNLAWLDDVERELPLVATVSGGQPIEETNDEFMKISEPFARLAGELCLVRVRGNSMESQHILNGDILICRRSGEPERHAIAVVELKDERGATVKRWERNGDDVVLASDFSDADSERIPTKIWLIGKTFQILGLIRRTR